ncbi:hypothetical protein ABEF92_001040 [Exophiala dermatitidis]|uniref:Uncharacterized protein n=1 Tax=Exophiala dermatitidis (strain ATCC 34100 / CBS 525.76 / NIH/UT8656) TaxID=858893 RepID=H6C994_EXODN|nr:uncharacterized protein HMPREF1120_08622 [Exophiala dermatitidis NIH/UT8656]EHY60671.1 hypothetical protein HMPREF1120_08622 [Exophiala dermatitidis NIH/UT8656]
MLKEELEGILQEVRYYHHRCILRSTCIPRLPAKPVTDPSVISEWGDVDAAIQALMSKKGTDIWESWESQIVIPSENLGVLPARHLYESVNHCRYIRNQPALRDTCRKDKNVRDAYAKTKLELAQRDWSSVDEYCEAKNGIIGWVLEQAGLSREDRKEIRRLNPTV